VPINTRACRRCSIAADEKLNAKAKQPYAIVMKDRSLFAFAGLWERWKDKASEVVRSCTIITTEPNEVRAPIHDRMPVIVRTRSDGQRRYFRSRVRARTADANPVSCSSEIQIRLPL
jgi:putative SOS response-associated peptidase YedK